MRRRGLGEQRRFGGEVLYPGIYHLDQPRKNCGRRCLGQSKRKPRTNRGTLKVRQKTHGNAHGYLSDWSFAIGRVMGVLVEPERTCGHGSLDYFIRKFDKSIQRAPNNSIGPLPAQKTHQAHIRVKRPRTAISTAGYWINTKEPHFNIILTERKSSAGIKWKERLHGGSKQ